MTKFGRECLSDYVQCINHAIHLAVMDVIFADDDAEEPAVVVPAPAEKQKKTRRRKQQASSSESSSESSDGESESEIDGEDSEAEAEANESIIEDDVSGDENMELDDETVPVREVLSRCKLTIKRMRKVVILFKSSPVKNSILQKILKRKIGKHLQLKLDVRTRWNSLVLSATRFLEIVDSVEEALSHGTIKKQHLWSEEDTNMLKVSVNFLCFNIK